ncbi:hypothetical protein OH146_01100 [Salinibacterium sp. SYSU T00001]|uniref:DUF6704 family protein n=1 Tax=Homoserinimonas sedimenticola TaxID=2986805 RepID=UPI002236BB13|nr:DUF6704 family protein [Salinibacterium sedimenticola]MCW4384365.1 hypothetical protein [Salinibacterium sedimenticola]
MSDDNTDPGHGHSPAAWTAVTIMLIAFAAGTLAFWLDQPVFVWASAGLLVVGLLVGWIMAKAGYGVGGHRTTPKDH